MSVPPIKLEWGGGKWPSRNKKAVRPHIELALDLAVEGFEELDIPVNGGKIVRVWRSGRKHGSEGAAIDDKVFEMYVSAEDVKRHRVARRAPTLISTAFHELFHTERFAHFPHETIAEMSVTEGLAWVATRMFAERLLLEDEQGCTRIAVHPDDVFDEDIIFDDFLDDIFNERTGQRSHVDLFNEWFDDPSGYLPTGVTLGVLAVQRGIGGGHTIAELMRLPAEEILGIQV